MKKVTQREAHQALLKIFGDFLSPWAGWTPEVRKKRHAQALAQMKQLPPACIQAAQALLAPLERQMQQDAEVKEKELAKLRQAQPTTVGELKRLLQYYPDDTPIRALPVHMAAAAVSAAALAPPVRRFAANGTPLAQARWSGDGPTLEELGI